MKITAVDSFVIDVAQKQPIAPYQSRYIATSRTGALLVRLETDQNITGVGGRIGIARENIAMAVEKQRAVPIRWDLNQVSRMIPEFPRIGLKASCHCLRSMLLSECWGGDCDCNRHYAHDPHQISESHLFLISTLEAFTLQSANALFARLRM